MNIKKEFIINQDDEELINELFEDLISAEEIEDFDCCESGGLGVKVDYIEDNGAVGFTVYRDIYMFELKPDEINKLKKKFYKKKVKE